MRTGESPGWVSNRSFILARTAGVQASAGRSTTNSCNIDRAWDSRVGSRTSLTLICNSRPRRSILPVTRTIRSVSISPGTAS